jgi:hypothetical protein
VTTDNADVVSLPYPARAFNHLARVSSRTDEFGQVNFLKDSGKRFGVS